MRVDAAPLREEQLELGFGWGAAQQTVHVFHGPRVYVAQQAHASPAYTPRMDKAGVCSSRGRSRWGVGGVVERTWGCCVWGGGVGGTSRAFKWEKSWDAQGGCGSTEQGVGRGSYDREC